MVETSSNVGIAMGLVLCAGAATALGSAVVYFPKFVKFVSPKVLAGSLGLSAGVMTYISFVEIFGKSVQAFVDAGNEDDMAYVYATLSFFGGVIMMKVVDVAVHYFLHDHDDESVSIQICHTHNGVQINKEVETEIVSPHCVGCVEDPVAELAEWRDLAEKEIEEHEREVERKQTELMEDGTSSKNSTASKQSNDSRRFADETQGVQFAMDIPRAKDETELVMEMQPPQPTMSNPEKEKEKLVKMGMNTAFAIALHNFPEGLATFVAAMADPKVGAILAIAIIIHNVPEGMCVSLPIYFATGNKNKAFLWGCVSGISEPIAALLGWLVLANVVSENAYGVLFAWTSGMMVIISLKELIPTAHRYDPKDAVVTNAIIGGMIVIALSLVLFKVNT